MAARSGPFFVYNAAEMPEALFDWFYKEFADRNQRVYVEWVVKNPGGPFGENPQWYTVENYGDTIKFNEDVDDWLVSVGAVPGETALVRTR